MSCVFISPFIFESVIISSLSPVFTGQLCALYESALCVKLTVLNLIFNCLGFKLAIAVYGGLFIEWSLFCVSCIPYVFFWSSDVAQCCFWPIETWDGLILKIKNSKKAPASLWFINCCFHLYNLMCNCFCSC